MIYCTNVPVAVYYSPDNGRYQPKLTLDDIREFLEPSPTLWDYGRARVWGWYRVRDVLRAAYRPAPATLCPTCGNAYCRC